MKKICSVVLMLMILSSFFVTVSAAETNGELIIGYIEYAPMNYHDGDTLVGFDTELAEYVCSNLGLKPVFKEIDWDTKNIELDSGSIDCIWNGLTITEERKQYMDITNCYLKCITNFEDEESIDEYGVAFKKGSLLTAKINSELDKAKNNGIIDSLISKYGIKTVDEQNISNTITVTINGNKVEFDTDPIIIENRTFVPIRAVCEMLGADVYWYEEEQSPIIVKNNKKIILEIDDEEMTIITCKDFNEFKDVFDKSVESNDESLLSNVMDTKILDVAPVIINDRTLLPIRAVCEALGTTVNWNSGCNTVEINCDEILKNEINTDKTFFDKLCSWAESSPYGSKEQVNGNITFTDSEGNVILDNNDIVKAEAKQGTLGSGQQEEYYIELTFTGEGKIKFAEATNRIANEIDGENYIAICVNGENISAPRVQAEIDSDTCIISGMFTKEAATELANIINGK